MNPAELFRQETNTVQLAPGDFLFREGEKGDKMYVLLEGEVDIFLGDFVLETAGPGALLGEMALINDSPRTANAVAKIPLAGANRPAPVSLSRSADTAFCDACDENSGQSPASHERRDGRAIASLERDQRLFRRRACGVIFRQMRIVAQYLLFAAIATTGCGQQAPTAADFAAQRQRMVEQQLKPRGIKDERVLAAMAKVPREEFIPADARADAYEDGPLPIGYDQTISQPYVVAFMTEQLRPKPSDRVLEIGSGSGYQAAILAELVADVYTIDIVEPLAKTAEATLQRLGYNNVHIKVGDGYKGWPEEAPFDAVIVTCAPEKVPQPLVDQLKDGGRMVIPVGERFAQQLYLLEKKNGQLKESATLPVRFVPMLREGKRNDCSVRCREGPLYLCGRSQLR